MCERGIPYEHCRNLFQTSNCNRFSHWILFYSNEHDNAPLFESRLSCVWLWVLVSEWLSVIACVDVHRHITRRIERERTRATDTERERDKARSSWYARGSHRHCSRFLACEATQQSSIYVFRYFMWTLWARSDRIGFASSSSSSSSRVVNSPTAWTRRSTCSACIWLVFGGRRLRCLLRRRFCVDVNYFISFFFRFHLVARFRWCSFANVWTRHDKTTVN